MWTSSVIRECVLGIVHPWCWIDYRINKQLIIMFALIPSVVTSFATISFKVVLTINIKQIRLFSFNESFSSIYHFQMSHNLLLSSDILNYLVFDQHGFWYINCTFKTTTLHFSKWLQSKLILFIWFKILLNMKKRKYCKNIIFVLTQN